MLPEELTLGLAPPVMASGTSNVGQRYRIQHPPQTMTGLVAHVMNLVDPTVHSKDPAAGSLHLAHKWQIIQCSLSIEGRLDVFQGKHLDDVSGTQPGALQRPESQPGQDALGRNSVGRRGEEVSLPRGHPGIAPQANQAAGTNQQRRDEAQHQQGLEKGNEQRRRAPQRRPRNRDQT